MNDWQDGAVVVDGVRLHYTRTGGNLPPLVLAHGFTDDGLCWTPVAQALQDKYDCIMVDARGHGQSDAPESPYSAAQLADDLAGVIKMLGLRHAQILGHSMGAVTALVLAARHPSLPGSILMEDPPLGWILDAEPAVNHEWIAELRAAYPLSISEAALIARQRTIAPGWSAAELDPWAASKRRFNPRAIQILEHDRADMNTPRALGSVTCPALLITADTALGAIATEQDAAALHAQVPQLVITHVAGAGHNIRREQFDAFMAVVRDFLAAHI